MVKMEIIHLYSSLLDNPLRGKGREKHRLKSKPQTYTIQKLIFLGKILTCVRSVI